MKPTLTLSPALRSAVALFVSRLPGHFSLAAGVDPEAGANPYFVELRVSASGLTRGRERIAFESEAQVLEALVALEHKLGLPPVLPKKEATARGFSDLERELAILGTTASIAA